MKTIRVTGEGAKRLDRALLEIKGKVGKVGWFEKSRYPEAPNLPVAYVATVQEFGDPHNHIPPRPMLRPTIIEKREEWKATAERSVRAIIAGKLSGLQAMEALGQKAAGDVRKKITQIISPPLSPVTIANRLKKRANKKKVGNLTKPLIDTGLLLATCINVTETE